MQDERPEPSDSKEAWLEHFTGLMAKPSPHEEAFFARRREFGLGVGLDAEGRLVRASARARQADDDQSR